MRESQNKAQFNILKVKGDEFIMYQKSNIPKQQSGKMALDPMSKSAKKLAYQAFYKGGVKSFRVNFNYNMQKCKNVHFLNNGIRYKKCLTTNKFDVYK